MRGCLQKAKTAKRGLPNGHFTWRIILALGRGADGKHRQKWVTFHGTRKEAEAKLNDLVGDVNHGKFIQPSVLTVGYYLDEWLEISIKPRRAVNTYKSYEMTIRHLNKALGHILLQQLSVLHVERYYAESKHSQATLRLHHVILTCALRAAVKKKLLPENVAGLASNIPARQSGGDVLDNVWTADETRRFLTEVESKENEQYHAFFALALDSGARKGELLALQWKDLDGNKLRIERQLLQKEKDGKLTYMPPKRGGVRSVELAEQTVALLQAHKRKQAELKIANRIAYHDHGLIFAQQWEHAGSKFFNLGDPLGTMCVNRNLKALCKDANVKPITVHGLRHTSTTLSLAAGVPPHVVQRRLGHKRVEVTLNIYSHVLQSMQEDAASRIGAQLYG